MPTKDILVCLDLRREHARGLLNGVRAYATDATHRCNLHFQADGALTTESLAGQGIVGAVGMFHNRSDTRLLRERKIPFVNLDKAGLRRDELTVQVDEDGLAKLAMEHFLERGYTDFGYLWYGSGWNILDRGRAFQRRVKELQNDDPDVTLRFCRLVGDFRGSKMDRFLQELPTPAGVFVLNDARAAHVVAAAVDLGLAVPEDIGVLGVDDDELICCACQPSLSSIPLPDRKIGYRAMAMLDRIIAGDEPDEKMDFVSPLTVEPRASTDLAACEDPGIAEALRFIRDYAHRGIDVGDVMSTQTCSRPNFEKRFRAQTGRSPLEMIRYHRISGAKRLLMNTDWPLWQIAERSGFASASHLCTSFKKLQGQSPGEFRRSARYY